MKQLPQNIEAEQSVIGACLVNPKIITQVAAVLSPADFYSTAHQDIFCGMTELKQTCDVVTLRNWLISHGHKTETLADLIDIVSTSAGWRHHADIVKDCAIRRQIKQQCQMTIQQVDDPTIVTDEILAKTRNNFNSLSIQDQFEYRQGVDISNVYTAEKCLQEYSEYIGKLKHNRFLTGISEIDKRIRGVSGGEVLYIIARAGAFKTATLQNLLKNYVNNSAWKAALFEIEMPVAAITERYHEIINGITGREVEEFYTSEVEGVESHRKALEEQFMEALKGLYTIPTRVSIKDIAEYVRLIEREHKEKIGVIGIDYLGLMEGEGKNEYEVVSKLATQIKGMAKLLDIPVIVLTQTSRKGEEGATEIEMSFARGSGAIEESGDFVFGLYKAERETALTTGFDIICKILKNRKGPTGQRFMLDLDPETLRLGPDARLYEPPKKENNNKGMR